MSYAQNSWFIGWTKPAYFVSNGHDMAWIWCMTLIYLISECEPAEAESSLSKQKAAGDSAGLRYLASWVSSQLIRLWYALASLLITAQPLCGAVHLAVTYLELPKPNVGCVCKAGGKPGEAHSFQKHKKYGCLYGINTGGCTGKMRVEMNETRGLYSKPWGFLT